MDVDDNVDLDIYGDLADFDLAEKLREAHESVADLTARLNASIETITRMEATNKEITRDKNSLSKNLSSLLFTAKNEIHRKDREIESLRREKEDICFRRNQAVSKNQRPTPNIAICKSMKVQTELSFSGDDCIEVQRTGQFHVAVSVKSSQKGDLDRDRQISNDKRRDVSRTQSHSDRDGPRYNEQRNPFAFHHLDKVDRRRKSVDCRSSRSDSGKGRTGGVETDKVRKYESKDRATKRHLDSSDNDERYPKRPKQNSPDRYKRRDDRRCTEIDGRPTKTRSDVNRGSASRSHSDSSDRANEVKGSLSMPRNEPTVEIRDPLSRQDVRCEKPIKINVKQINANVAISRDIDSTKELIRESKLQPIVGIEKIISVNIPQLKDSGIPTHKTDIVEATPKVNQKEQTLIDLPANTTITSSRLRDSTKSDSHSPDSTTLNEDSKTSSLDGNANSPAVELFTCSKPVDTSMQLPSQLQSNLQPLPSVFELFKPPVDKPQLQSRPHADNDISTTKATNSDNPIHTNTVPITSDTAMTTKTAKSQNQNILGSSEIFKDIQTSVNTSTISCRPITTAKEITLGTKSDVSACSTVTCGQSKLTDNTSTKSCKPITSRRKTVAVEATSKAKDINLQAKQDTTIINKPATLLTEASSNITCGQSHNKNQLSETSNDVSKKSCKPITLRRKTMAAEPKCNPRLAKEINATSTVKNKSEGITFSSDEIPNKTCKPITSRRKTLAAEPTTNRITKLNRAKPSETPTIDSTSSVGVKKSVCETSKTNRNVYKPNTNKVLAKEEIVTKPEDNQSKTAKPKTRIKSETKKGNGSKEADKNPKSNVAKQKSPLNVLFDELHEFTDLRSKLRSQKGQIKETPNTTKHTESVKSEDESNRNAKFQKPIVEKTSLDRKDVRDRQESQDKPSEDFPATKLDKEKPQKDNSIEQKLANLFGFETSGSEHCSPINIPESDLRSCLENAFRASDVTAVNSTNSPEPINICDTPIASLVEQIFSTNDEGCNDPNVSDASSTSLRVVRESVEQIDLYLTRRKRQSNGKHRFRQCLAVAELNSSTESKTIDLSDNHNSVSMDVDIELTQKCIHDAQAQTSSIISLFDALQTPRKSDPKFELVEDTGSLFGKSVATPKIPKNVDQCSLSFAPNVNGNANIPNEDNRITKPTQLSTIAHALVTLTDTSSELNVPGVQSITANTENLANQSSCHVDGKFLADHSFVPSHQAPSTMDQSFLNMIPIKNHHVDRVIANHYEEYLSDVKINDLSTLSDLFGAEDLPSRTQAMFGDKQQSANTDNIEKLPSMSSDLKEITTSPSEPIKSLSKETDQTNPTPTPDVLPETSADPIPQIPTTELQPIPAALVTTQPPLQTSITEEIAANTSSTSNSTPSHTKTARLSYYVEEDTTNNEVTMFITRKKKRKTKK